MKYYLDSVCNVCNKTTRIEIPFSNYNKMVIKVDFYKVKMEWYLKDLCTVLTQIIDSKHKHIKLIIN